MSETFESADWYSATLKGLRATLEGTEELEPMPLGPARPDSRDLQTSSGERLEGFFPMSGHALVRRWLETLDRRDLERQTRNLRTSMGNVLCH